MTRSATCLEIFSFTRKENVNFGSTALSQLLRCQYILLSLKCYYLRCLHSCKSDECFLGYLFNRLTNPNDRRNLFRNLVGKNELQNVQFINLVPN